MKKYIGAIIGIIILAASILLYQNPEVFAKSAENKKPDGEAKKANITTAFVRNVENRQIPITVTATGSLMAKDRIELFAEVQGVFEESSKSFKPGVRYGKGEMLLKMRGDENYANLQAQKSTLYNLITTSLPDLKIDYPEAFPNWEKYVKEFDLEKPVKPLPEATATKEKVFISSKNIFTTYYNVKSLEIRQGKYLIRAPFSGVLTAADITPGTLVRAGQRLGEFISTGTFELEVAVNASFAPYLQVGKSVEVRSINDHSKTWTGKVVRINGKVDRESQTTTVYLQVQGNNLQEGMYLEATIKAREEENVFELPRNLLIDQNKVYIAKDGKLGLITIQPIHFSEQTVIVKGLENGMKVLAKGLPGAFSGMAVELLEEGK